MVIPIQIDLESALKAAARKQGVTPEELAVTTLRQRFMPRPLPFEPRDEWERGLLEAAVDCGVSLSNEAVSSEGLYD
jgi:hypothetical protein